MGVGIGGNGRGELLTVQLSLGYVMPECYNARIPRKQKYYNAKLCGIVSKSSVTGGSEFPFPERGL